MANFPKSKRFSRQFFRAELGACVHPCILQIKVRLCVGCGGAFFFFFFFFFFSILVCGGRGGGPEDEGEGEAVEAVVEEQIGSRDSVAGRVHRSLTAQRGGRAGEGVVGVRG